MADHFSMQDAPVCGWCAGIGPTGGGDKLGSVLGLNARHKGRNFSWSHYIIVGSLLIRVKSNDEIFNFPLLHPYLFLKRD